jgi:hypothetical protein
MLAVVRFSMLFAAISAASASASPAGNAGVVNNVLTQWRGQAEKCEDPRQRDFHALVNVAMFEAINAVTPRFTPYTKAIAAPAGSSAEAAAARAAHDVLVLVCEDQKEQFAKALKTSLESVTDSAARDRGETVGAKAAAAVIAARAGSKAEGRDPVYAPPAAGVFSPTTRRVGMVFAAQSPWIMKTPDEMRPVAPPDLKSETWARDLNEVKRLGARKSKDRTAEQTDVAQFWAGRSVRIVLNQLIGRPGRSLVDDARFLALAEMAWADSYVAMMDGKYHYLFWRPVTAIRNAGMDGNDATVADPQWEPATETPPHPEYPCGHCASAGAVGTVIANEFGAGAPPMVLEMEDVLLRRYDTPQQYIDDVSISRLYVGVHYRFSVDAGKKQGVAIGDVAAQRFFTPLAK